MATGASTAIRTALAGLFMMACVMGIGRFVYTPILPSMIAGGALGVREAGLVAGANFLGYLVGALGASFYAFQQRPRVWMMAGVVLSLMTTAAMAMDAGLAAMAAVRFLSGIASAYGMIFITALVMTRLAADRRPELIAFHFGGVGIGIAASALLVARLAEAGAGWQAQWMGAAILAGASAAAAIILLPPRDPILASGAAEGAKDDRFGLPLVILTVGYGLFGFGYVITATFINAMAKSVPQLQPVEPWVWMVVGLSGLPSLVLWNRLARSTGLLAA